MRIPIAEFQDKVWRILKAVHGTRRAKEYIKTVEVTRSPEGVLLWKVIYHNGITIGEPLGPLENESDLDEYLGYSVAFWMSSIHRQDWPWLKANLELHARYPKDTLLKAAIKDKLRRRTKPKKAPKP